GGLGASCERSTSRRGAAKPRRFSRSGHVVGRLGVEERARLFSERRARVKAARFASGLTRRCRPLRGDRPPCRRRCRRGRRPGRGAWPRGDRKSTRLNSSHVKISYAVFCLKKKKEKDWRSTST